VKVELDNIHKVFESKVRLGIMSALLVNESLDFTALKEFLEVTDGNLATHLKTLQKNDFITIKKRFLDNKPNTQYAISKEGRLAFTAHLNALEALLKQLK
jgi:DNA-binding HxlR family transcriptional regulator